MPLFQSESKCETILMKMKLHAELIFALRLVLKQGYPVRFDGVQEGWGRMGTTIIHLVYTSAKSFSVGRFLHSHLILCFLSSKDFCSMLDDD